MRNIKCKHLAFTTRTFYAPPCDRDVKINDRDNTGIILFVALGCTTIVQTCSMCGTIKQIKIAGKEVPTP